MSNARTDLNLTLWPVALSTSKSNPPQLEDTVTTCINPVIYTSPSIEVYSAKRNWHDLYVT